MPTTDLTVSVHKAWRRYMFDVLVRTGALDVSRREEVGHELLRLHEAEAASPCTADDGVAAALARRQRLALLDADEVDDMLGWMADALAPWELSALLEDLHAAA